MITCNAFWVVLALNPLMLPCFSYFKPQLSPSTLPKTTCTPKRKRTRRVSEHILIPLIFSLERTRTVTLVIISDLTPTGGSVVVRHSQQVAQVVVVVPQWQWLWHASVSGSGSVIIMT